MKALALYRAQSLSALVFLGIASIVPLAKAGAPSTCDGISKDVREAVTKDPSKVLMIVEDALVINESCACEIIKAAITASGADTAMVQQIVQTGLAVAPKMGAIITECAEAVAPGSGVAVAAVADNKGSAKSPAEKIVPSTETTEGSDFSNAWATNIRGVYLIQPAAAGFITQVDEGDGEEDDDSDEDDGDTNRAQSRRTRNLVPLSPARANP